ncbi:MAG TPA: type I DNA topoisomerase [Candidatus Alistipes intestinigallinarum]|uniref:DNA topoisomerase 1 n=1 Tax=Candidatus Alistipes intestinigallinarum TaxID=2838440 RepID=A0A9D1Z2B9_9BACT|nr:type I DNA topoisomerase [Candidatus Alistipes intestinigallinarum]
MQDNLVIVESPAKAKTIEKFLGKDFVVKSSFGHIRDLAKKDLGINIEQGFKPVYEIPADKKKVVDELAKLAKSKTVWLASDEDREGEAIAWHLTEVLGLPVEQTKRIVFHEITKRAILEAIEKPRTVNMDLVNAQQARRILDRLVGFELSPVLWKKVKPSLSAGRVQSVAVRLIVEREREIIAFRSTPYFRVVAQFHAADDPDKTLFKAELPTRFETVEQAEAFLNSCIGATFTVAKAEEKPAQRYPAPPFTTSTLQQEAGRKLGMSVSRTMSVAQHLYEQGLITYMRTDSVNLSQQALAQCKEEIIKLYGEKYSRWFNYKTKTKGAQEAHEAIRPSYIERQEIDGTAEEKRLYELIWKRTVASQMVCAELDRTTITIDMSGSDQQFVAQGEVVRFDGFLRLYSESTDDDQAAESGEARLPKLKTGDRLQAEKITATERFTSAPARYNEASLVKRLEELGIGRPSTYAPTITTIINRGYVVKQNKEGQKRAYTQLTLKGEKIARETLSENYGKEKSRLSPTDIGMVVNDYLEEQFAPIIDYNFTANVEKEFDRIAEGDITWEKMIGDFYGPFHKMVDNAISTQSSKPRENRILGNDPKTGHVVKARIGRYGPMVEIEGAEGEKSRFASLKKGQLIESITLEEALELFALPREVGELDGEKLVVGLGKYGPYVRYGKSFASLAKGDDPYTLTHERAVEIVREHQAAAAAANTPLKSFPEDPDMLVKNGRYGAYIAYKGKNYRIPKGTKPEDLTLEACLKIVAGSKK